MALIRENNSSDNALLIVCLAMMMGVALFLGVAWFVVPAGGLVPDLDRSLAQALATTSILCLIGANLFETRRRRIAESHPADDPEQAKKKTTIIAFGMREGAGFLAIMMGMFSGQMGFASVLAGVVLVVMAISLPRTR